MNLEIYNKMVSDRLKGYDMEYAKRNDLDNLSKNNELLRGGTRPRKHVMVGTDSSTYAPSHNAPAELVGVSGGKVNRLKKAKKWTDFAVDTANKGIDLAKKGQDELSGGSKDLDKAKAVLKSYMDGKRKSGPTKKQKDLLEQHGIISKTGDASGGKVNRLKKAKRWTGFVADTVDKGIDLAKKGMDSFGGAKTPSPWIAHVKKVAADKNISYKEALKVASSSYKK